MAKVINNYYFELELLGVEFEDKKEFENFLFDYACASLEYNQKEKTEENIQKKIKSKLENLCGWAKKMDIDPKKSITISLSEKEATILEMIEFEKEKGEDGLQYVLGQK